MEVLTYAQILSSQDWQEAFADEGAYGGNTDKTVEAFGCPDAPFTRQDIAVVLANGQIDGDYAETEVFGVFLLKDGRYAAVNASCDTTGWDCQAGNTMTVASTLADVVQFGLTDNHRRELASQLSIYGLSL